MIRLLVLLSFAFVFSSNLAAQEVEKTASWLPKDVSIHAYLCHLSLAKVSKDGKAIHFAKPKVRLTTEIRTVKKTVLQDEERVRVVRKNLVEEKETYTVQVPIPVDEQQYHIVPVLDGGVKFTVPIDQLRACDLSGNAIDVASLMKRLEKPTHVLASEALPDQPLKPVDPFFGSVLRSDTIVIFASPGLLTTEEEQKSLRVPAVPAFDKATKAK